MGLSVETQSLLYSSHTVIQKPDNTVCKESQSGGTEMSKLPCHSENTSMIADKGVSKEYYDL